MLKLAGTGRSLPAARVRAEGTQRAAVRRRRPLGRAAAGGLPPRHLSLVLGRRADPLVVARPAHGAVLRRAEGLALARQERAQQGLRGQRSTRVLPACIEACAETEKRRARAPGSARTCAPPTSRCTAPGTRTPSRPGATASWSAGSTAWRIGRMFYGESMFSTETDASKVALVGLVEDLRRRGHAAHRLPAAHPAAGLPGRPGDSAPGVFTSLSQHW